MRGKIISPLIRLRELIAMVHRSFSGLGQSVPVPAAVPLEPAVPIRRSGQHDYVACLECGFLGQTLRRHLCVAAWSLNQRRIAGVWNLAASSSADGTDPPRAAFDDVGPAGPPRSGVAVSRWMPPHPPAPEVIAPPRAAAGPQTAIGRRRVARVSTARTERGQARLTRSAPGASQNSSSLRLI